MKYGKVRGLEETLQALDRETKRIKNATEAGVVKAALFIKGEAMKRAPVVTGNLRNSAYVVTSKGAPEGEGDGRFVGTVSGRMSADHEIEKAQSAAMAAVMTRMRGVVAMVGFSANYGYAVHENPNAGKGSMTRSKPAYKQQSQSGGWKFLENALKENASKVSQIIQSSVK